MKILTGKLLAGLTALLAGGITAQAQYTYTTLDHPLAGPQGTRPSGIDGPNIVGYYQDASNLSHGFLYNGGAWTTVDYPGAFDTSVSGISGTNLVGTYDLMDTNGLLNSHGFVYNGITWTTLDYPLNTNGTALEGISGTNIVGRYVIETQFNTPISAGLIYNGNTWTSFFSRDETYASGVSGDNVVGSHVYNAYEDVEGFIYNGGTWTTFSAPLGTNDTWAFGIDETNVVGYFVDTNGVTHGFLYNGSTWTTLDDPLGVNDTVCQGISGGSIVGYYSDASGAVHGFLATPIPQLTITTAGSALQISWPSWATNYLLQQNLDLASTNWGPVSEAPALNVSKMQYELVLDPVFVARTPNTISG